MRTSSLAFCRERVARRGGRGCCSGPGLFGHRYSKGEPRPLARPVALSPDAATVCLHDPLAEGKAKTRTTDLAFPSSSSVRENFLNRCGNCSAEIPLPSSATVTATWKSSRTAGHPDGPTTPASALPRWIGDWDRTWDDARSVCHDRGQVQREVEVEVVPSTGCLGRCS